MNCNSYNCFNTVYCGEKINVKIIQFAVIVPKRVGVDITTFYVALIIGTSQ